jgi:DNA-binding response OmpR family regulator
MPELNGYEFMRLFSKEAETPVIMLTAKVADQDKIVGLELGADDYLAKPFSLKELIARIRALLRRARINTEDKLQGALTVGPLSIDVDRHEVRMGERLLKLTRTEFSLLKYLTRDPGRVFTRDELITALWGEDRFIEEHNLDVHIHSLRQQIQPDPTHAILLTVRGVGYKLQLSDKDR